MQIRHLGMDMNILRINNKTVILFNNKIFRSKKNMSLYVFENISKIFVMCVPDFMNVFISVCVCVCVCVYVCKIHGKNKCCIATYIYKYMRNIIKNNDELQWTNKHTSL